MVVYEFTLTRWQKEEDGRTFCDKRNRTITCVFFVVILALHGEVWRKVFSVIIIVTLVTKGLLSSFLSRPVA